MSLCSDQIICLRTTKCLVDVTVSLLTRLVLTPRNKVCFSLVHTSGTAI
jgi:hypothetical protein